MGWPQRSSRGQLENAKLENQLQAELNHAGIHTRAGNLAERGRIDIRQSWKSKIRLVELRVIEQVEELSPELQRGPLGDRSHLLHCDVEVELAWTQDDSRAGIAEPGSGGVAEGNYGRRAESRIVEIVAQPGLGASRAGDIRIGHAGTKLRAAESALNGSTTADSISRASAGIDDRHRGAALYRGHAREVPAV